MTYQDWVDTHNKKRESILTKLQGKSLEEIVAYFDYDNMVVMEPTFCELYENNIKCHAMEGLNCYNCDCPYFIFSDKGLYIDEGVIVYSDCIINAKKGGKFKTDTGVHQDCSDCTIPHTTAFTLKTLKRRLNG